MAACPFGMQANWVVKWSLQRSNLVPCRCSGALHLVKWALCPSPSGLLFISHWPSGLQVSELTLMSYKFISYHALTYILHFNYLILFFLHNFNYIIFRWTMAVTLMCGQRSTSYWYLTCAISDVLSCHVFRWPWDPGRDTTWSIDQEILSHLKFFFFQNPFWLSSSLVIIYLLRRFCL